MTNNNSAAFNEIKILLGNIQKQLDTDVKELKTDVKELKTDVKELKTDVTQLKTDVTQLKTDVTQLKTDVTQLKTDVTQLKKEVKQLKTDVSSLVDWQKKSSDASEYKFNNRLLQIFDENCKSFNIKQIYLKLFIDKDTGHSITDLDGCFIISNKFFIQPKSFPIQAIKAFSKAKRKNNSTNLETVSYLLIIETKLTIDKRIIDSKLKQIMRIKENIQAFKQPNIQAIYNQNYLDMCKYFEIDKFSEDILLIFGCENVPRELLLYIEKINNGDLDEPNYKVISFSLLQTDRTYNEFMILYNSDPNKDLFKRKDLTNFDTFKQFLIDLKIYASSDNKINKLKSYIPYLNDCTLNYAELESVFIEMKNKTGYITKNKELIPVFYCN
jgi:outer membrane murein-binding lipoprotein Lpp